MPKKRQPLEEINLVEGEVPQKRIRKKKETDKDGFFRNSGVDIKMNVAMALATGVHPNDVIKQYNVSRQTLINWQKEDERFKSFLDEAIKIDAEMFQLLYSRESFNNREINFRLSLCKSRELALNVLCQVMTDSSRDVHLRTEIAKSVLEFSTKILPLGDGETDRNLFNPNFFNSKTGMTIENQQDELKDMIENMSNEELESMSKDLVKIDNVNNN